MSALVQTMLAPGARDSSVDGLTVTVFVNRREADRVIAAIGAMAVPAAPVARPAPSARSWTARRLMRDNGSVAPQVITEAGQELRFTGFGRGFFAGEAEGTLWGEPVRYAYYA
ncbi:hypothetical protein CTJ15_04605 (plasmid) [Roseomonas sp. FDAARGOS_362]|uniref:hypothetical protein n=1 Tax=Roseomonas sp. FDAARGOS_362 TaxID=2018065 RepID=UPI00035C4814|nr:hypothetical protein [Roseomonas sp. FDAARGOS_362]ATR19640.1 hypothetical protein CTJ15_04605 [Roseomonas sp. FDAARGOS_362]